MVAQHASLQALGLLLKCWERALGVSAVFVLYVYFIIENGQAS